MMGRIHFRNQQGQALVEYMLVFLITLSVTTLLNRNLKRHIQKMWFQLAAEIAAPCKSCTVPEQIPVSR